MSRFSLVVSMSCLVLVCSCGSDSPGIDPSLEQAAISAAQATQAGTFTQINETPIAVDDETPALRINVFVPDALAAGYRQFVPGQDNRSLAIPTDFTAVLEIKDVQDNLLRYEVMVHAPGVEGVEEGDFYWTEVNVAATEVNSETDVAACIQCHNDSTGNRGLIVGVAADNRAPVN